MKTKILLTLLLGAPSVLYSAAPANRADYESARMKIGDPVLKAEWIRCERDSDCVIIFSGCSVARAANGAHRAAATEALYTRYGDPRTMNCAESGYPSDYLAACVKKTCAAVAQNP